MLSQVVLIDGTTRSYKIHELYYSDLLHTNSQFATPRSTLNDLSSNFGWNLVAATSPNHQIFNMHVVLQLMLQESLKNSKSVLKNNTLLCM